MRKTDTMIETPVRSQKYCTGLFYDIQQIHWLLQKEQSVVEKAGSRERSKNLLQ